MGPWPAVRAGSLRPGRRVQGCEAGAGTPTHLASGTCFSRLPLPAGLGCLCRWPGLRGPSARDCVPKPHHRWGNLSGIAHLRTKHGPGVPRLAWSPQALLPRPPPLCRPTLERSSPQGAFGWGTGCQDLGAAQARPWPLSPRQWCGRQVMERGCGLLGTSLRCRLSLFCSRRPRVPKTAQVGPLPPSRPFHPVGGRPVLGLESLGAAQPGP